MALTDIEVCQRALVMIGANPITSFTEGTTEATACANLYEGVKKDALSSYRWRFCMGYVNLSRLNDAPTAGEWEAAYQLPDTVLHINTLWAGDRRINFDRYEDKVYCNASTNETVTAEGHFEVDEQFWPPYFAHHMALRMAALLAEPIGAKTDLANKFEEKVMRHGALARNADSQGRTPARIDRGRITSRRFRRSTQYSVSDYD